MDLRHLRYLIAVAEEGTFVRAATRLRLAQPALSRQIHALERELDVDLFERGLKRVTVTPAGSKALESAREILAATSAAIEHARQSHHGEAGRCVLGVGKIPLMNGTAARVVEQAAHEYPRIEIEMLERALDKQWEAVRSGEVDIGLGAIPTAAYGDLTREVQSIEIIDTVFVSDRHPLASRLSIQLKDLAGEALLVTPAFTSTIQKLNEQLRSQGERELVPRPVQTPAEMIALVAAGMGNAVLPHSVRHITFSNAVMIPIEDTALEVSLYRIWRAGDLRPSVKAVLQILRTLDARLNEGKTKPKPDDDPDSRELPFPIELRHLRYFVAVVEEGSFGRAAERLEMTQPALSRQIRELEDAVGVPLLERETRGSSMTFAGQTLYDEAREIIAMVDRMATEAKRSLRAMEGRVILGLVPHPVVRLLVPDLLRHCQALHPDVRILLEDIPTPQQAVALRESRIDIALGHRHRSLASPDDELVRDQLVDDTFDSALLPAGHELARRAELSIRELADVPFAWPPRAFFPAFYDYVMASFEDAGLKPRIEGEYAGLETMWSIVGRGHGWTLGMHSQRAHPPRDVVVVPLSDFSLEWGVDVMHRRDESHAPVLCVLDAILQSGQSTSEPAVRKASRRVDSPAPP